MAVFPIGAGFPDHSDADYNPAIYALQLLVEFYEYTVLGDITNTDYEGSVKEKGEKVKIRTLPDITINDFVDGQDLDYEDPNPDSIELLLDKAKYWGFRISDVQRLQSDLAYQGPWMQHFAKKLAEAIDAAVLGDIYSDVHASNTGASAGADSGDINLGVTAATGTPRVWLASNLPEIITDCATVLDEQQAPDEGRFLVLPSWACQRILLSDLKDASMTGDSTSILRNGKVGMIDRFTIYRSSQLTKTTVSTVNEWNCVFGHKVATTFATQMTKTETLKNPNTFGDLLRSLNVYGYKVVKPEALGHLVIKKAA